MYLLARIFLFTLFYTFVQLSYSQSSDTLEYIFLGHIKSKRNGLDKVDSRVEAIDFSKYDRIWLGGDVTDESNLFYENLEYIDSLFDVSNPSNHWAFGNHDLRNYNDEWLYDITQKRTFYTHHENGITTIVLNLSLPSSECEKLNEQFNLIKSVCDTITNSSHLILMSHHCVWNGVPGLPEPWKYAQSNLISWIANCQDKPGNFVSTIYPLLVNVKNRGIEVINVLGDSGVGNKGTSMLSTDSIHFIASGIEPKTQIEHGPDSLLIFKHYVRERRMTWGFHLLDSLR